MKASPASLPASSTVHPPCKIGRSPLASPPALGTILKPASRNQLLTCLTPHWTFDSPLGQLSLLGELWNAWRHTWLSHLATGPLAWSGGGARDALKPCTMRMTALPLPHNEGVPRRWYVDPQDGRETPRWQGATLRCQEGRGSESLLPWTGPLTCSPL